MDARCTLDELLRLTSYDRLGVPGVRSPDEGAVRRNENEGLTITVLSTTSRTGYARKLIGPEDGPGSTDVCCRWWIV
jgi:hypothetical protein